MIPRALDRPGLVENIHFEGLPRIMQAGAGIEETAMTPGAARAVT
jgi:hypothetical protein